jgi:hypothetical protein
MAGASAKNMPNLRNLAMELRKVCCHPYLCNGLEDDIFSRGHARGDVAGELDRMVAASGKMVLLGKLLPKLHAEGHKVRALPRQTPPPILIHVLHITWSVWPNVVYVFRMGFTSSRRVRCGLKG